MRLEQLEYLEAVATQGSLRRASEHVHLTQPALSEALGKLERELGVPLLDRQRTGTRVSRHGLELRPYMVEVLEAVRRLRQAAGDGGGPARPVRLGTVQAATGTTLAAALSRLGAERPDVSVEVVSLDHQALLTRLDEGSLDLGLVNELVGGPVDGLGAGRPAAAGATVLQEGRVVAAVPAAHPLAALDELTAADLHRHPFVAMRPGYLMHQVVLALGGGTLPPVTHFADGAEPGLAMVAAGVGATLLPDYSVADGPLHRAGLVALRPVVDPTGAPPPRVRLELRRSPFLRPGGAAAAVASALVEAPGQHPG